MRLGGIARAGYYPTPDRVAQSIAWHLQVAASGAGALRLLDPCCGEGLALQAVAQSLRERGGNLQTYGVELNAERAAVARQSLDHVLCTSSLGGLRLAHGAFQLLYLNPPYDYDEEKKRLEHAFLVALTRALAPGGVLAFIVPGKRLGVSARYLASHYERSLVYRFPDPEFGEYGQVVLFATRRAQPGLAPRAEMERLSEADTATLPVLPDEPAESYTLRPGKGGEVLFASALFDAREAAITARRQGLWVRPELVEALWPPAEKVVRPLMPLRKGHLALLIAAGMLDNLLIQEGDEHLLVKGKTTKTLVEAPSQREDTEVQREVIQTSVVTLDLLTGVFRDLSEGAAPVRTA